MTADFAVRPDLQYVYSQPPLRSANRLPAAAFSNVELALSNECPRPSVQCIIGPWLVARIGGGVEDDCVSIQPTAF